MSLNDKELMSYSIIFSIETQEKGQSKAMEKLKQQIQRLNEENKKLVAQISELRNRYARDLLLICLQSFLFVFERKHRTLSLLLTCLESLKIHELLVFILCAIDKEKH